MPGSPRRVGPSGPQTAASGPGAPSRSAVALIGAEGLHFHDLRHTGNTFAAAGGTGIKDLMARMGHDSERAALIYQHQASGADKLITNAFDAHVETERKRKEDDDDDGTAGALVPVG
jgi:integrase